MELSTITLSGDKFPILCDLAILEEIQEEFGDILTFSEKLIPISETNDGKKITKMPDVHAICYALPRFIDEGIEAYNANHKIKIEKITQKDIFRRCDLSLIDTAMAIYQELWRSINAPKQQPPAEMSQNQE